MANQTVYPYGTTGQLPTSIGLIDDLITGGVNKALTAQQGVVIGQRLAKAEVFRAVSDNLADAIAEIHDTSIMVPGAELSFFDNDGTHRHYRYIGQYYDAVTWGNLGSWLDLNDADKYRVDYFLLCPDLSKSISGKAFASDGTITSGDWYITDYLEIGANGLPIGGENLAHYVLYNEQKEQIGSRATLYKAKIFTQEDGAFVRVEYKEAAPITWKLGYTSGGHAWPHVTVEKNYRDVVDYNDIDYLNYMSGYIPVTKGEVIYIHTVDSDIADSERKMTFLRYDENKVLLGTSSGVTSLTIGDETYIKIGASAKRFDAYYRSGYRYSRSISKTWGKKRWLALGDSNTALSIATRNYTKLISEDREISVTNRAVSGQTSAQQLAVLRGIDVTAFDCITILVGGNDFGYQTGAANLKSNLLAMIDYIEASHPTCKIGLMTMFNRFGIEDSTMDGGNVNTRGEYQTAIREAAQERCVPLLDIQHECQCDLRNQLYTDGYSVNADGRHLNNAAHLAFVYPLIKQFLYRLISPGQ